MDSLGAILCVIIIVFTLAGFGVGHMVGHDRVTSDCAKYGAYKSFSFEMTCEVKK